MTNKDKYFYLCRNLLNLKATDEQICAFLTLEYLPLYLWLKKLFLVKKNDSVYLGIAGINGVGKTSLARFLKLLLESEGFNVVHFSMDDLYPTKSFRMKLAEKIHPNLKIRLMYDNSQVKRVFSGIQNWQKPIKIPKFDKATDDRFPEENWLIVTKKPDFVIVEGVFIFAKPVADNNLSKADNYINSLVRDLLDVYSFIDVKITLLTDSFENIIQFRQQQERELQDSRGKYTGMTSEQVESFIRYFQTYLERYTYSQEQDPLIDLAFIYNIDRQISRIYSPKQNLVYFSK